MQRIDFLLNVGLAAELNLYLYCASSPATFVDPFALQSLLKCLESPALLRICLETGAAQLGNIGKKYCGNGKDLIKLLEKWGGTVVKGGKGSHTKIKMPNRRIEIVPE